MKLLFIAGTLACTALAYAPSYAATVIGVTSGNTLFSFDTNAIQNGRIAITNERAIIRLTGTLFSVDYRPATGAFYALTNSAGTGRLYTVNTVSGIATLASTLTSTLSGNTFDIAFNPTVDRLRLVSDTGQNLRINVFTGATTVDGALGQNGIVGAAYTNQNPGATNTTLYTLDSSNGGNLNTQSPPNIGTQNMVGATGSPQLDSFDIDGSTGVAYAGDASRFGTVNLVTGTFQSLGLYGRNDVIDFSIAPSSAVIGTVPEPATWAMMLVGFAMIGGTARYRRRSFKITYA